MCDSINSERNGSSFKYEAYNDKIVKAVLMDTRDDFDNVAEKIFDRANTESFYVVGLAPYMNETYVGKAKVNFDDGDMFDFDTGKEIARKRCLEKYHKAFDKRMCQLLYDARKLEATIEFYAKKKGVNLSSVPNVEEVLKNKYQG